jgi:hypothetical protein
MRAIPARMIPPPNPAEPERVDPEAYRTANLADPELVAAYEVENEAVRLDVETIGWASALGLIPFMLVLLLLSAAFGDWAWDLALPLFVVGTACLVLVRMGLFRRYASDLPIHLPNGEVISGARKRRLLLGAGALGALIVLDQGFGLVGLVRRWFVDWFGGWLATVL